MRVIDLNGLAVHWREDGDLDGTPVLFANSLGTDLRLWDDLLPHLPAGLRLIRYDLRGHGLTACPPGPYAIDDLATDAEGLIEALDLGSCHFVGLSIGGMVGQRLAARRPDLIRSLVLSNTAARMGTPEMWNARIAAIRAGGLESVADAILERWFAKPFLARPEVAGWRNMMTRTPQEGYLGCCAAIAAADLRETTRRLELPVLGIAGDCDGASPAEVVAATIATIHGARIEVLSGTGHLPCVEAPAAHAKLISGFLEETSHV